MTRFDIVAFPQGPIWGGTAIYNVTSREQLLPHLKAFNEFTDAVYKDPYGSLILLWYYAVAAKTFVVENLYEYTKDVANPAVFPPAFVNFSQTSAIGPPVTNTLRVATLSNLTGELNSPPDVR